MEAITQAPKSAIVIPGRIEAFTAKTFPRNWGIVKLETAVNLEHRQAMQQNVTRSEVVEVARGC